MNSEKLEFLVFVNMRKIESYGSSIWLGCKSSSVINMNGIHLQTRIPTSNDGTEQRKSPLSLTLKYFIPASSMEEVGKEQEQLFFSDEHQETSSVLLTHEAYLTLGGKYHTTEQERSIFYLEKEDGFPSLFDQCDDLGECGMSSETTDKF